MPKNYEFADQMATSAAGLIISGDPEAKRIAYWSICFPGVCGVRLEKITGGQEEEPAILSHWPTPAPLGVNPFANKVLKAIQKEKAIGITNAGMTLDIKTSRDGCWQWDMVAEEDGTAGDLAEQIREEGYPESSLEQLQINHGPSTYLYVPADSRVGIKVPASVNSTHPAFEFMLETMAPEHVSEAQHLGDRMLAMVRASLN